VKWTVATATVVTAAILSAPVAGATPNNNNGGANNVGQTISNIATIAGGGGTPGVWLETLNGLGGLLGKLGFGKDRGSGNGAALQQQTLDNVGKTLPKPKPVDEPDPADSEKEPVFP